MGGKTDGTTSENPKELSVCIDEWQNQQYTFEMLSSLFEATNSDDVYKQHYGVIGLRKLLSKEDGGPIQEIIDGGMVPRLVTFTQSDGEPELQLEAAWALTNIASGSTQQAQAIVNEDGINHFIRLLQSNNLKIVEQAIWALGNLAGDNIAFRDCILMSGGLQPVLNYIITCSDKSVLANAVWTASNLCRGKPLPKSELVQAAIPALAGVVQREDSTEVLIDALWALSFLTEIGGTMITEIQQTGVLSSIVQYLSSPQLTVLTPCVRIVGNIATGTEEQTDMLLKVPGFLDKIFALLNNPKKVIRKEACWTISNITAGSAAQIGLIASNSDYIMKLVHIAKTDSEDVRKEVMWVLSNATQHANLQMFNQMLEWGVLDCFIEGLDSNQPQTLQVVLDGIDNMLKLGAQIAAEFESPSNKFLEELESRGGVEKIEQLQAHQDNDVYVKALKILENYLEVDETE